MLADRRDVYATADEERADSEDAEAAYRQQLVSPRGRSGDAPAGRRPPRHLALAALVAALGASVLALALVGGRIPRAARRQERAAAVLVEELIGTVGVPGCEDAVGIDTPWGDSCQAVAGECSDVEHGDQVRGLCPVTCGACGGQQAQQAPQAPQAQQAQQVQRPAAPAGLAPAGGGQEAPPPAQSGLPAAFEAQGGCKDRDLDSCRKLVKFCVGHQMSIEVQGACPASCGVCGNSAVPAPVPAPAPAAPGALEQAPASTAVATTTCPSQAQGCAMQSAAGAGGAPASGATDTAASAPAGGGGGAAGAGGELCEDRDMAMCAQIVGYCQHADLGAQVRGACRKSCGLCGDASVAAPAAVPPATASATTAAPTTAAPTTSAAPTTAATAAAAKTPPPTPAPSTAASTTAEPATQPPTLAPTTTAAAATTAEAEEDAAPAPAEAEEETEPAPAPSQECTKPGEDCSLAKCCADPGMQCYQKNSQFATCHVDCDPEEPDDEEELWTCKKLGQRTEDRASEEEGNGTSCSKSGDDCSASKCCEDPGFMCYSKNKYFSSCKTTCAKGERDTPKDDPWECEELGERTPWPPEMQVCQWPADNCIISKCCKMPETTCYKQDEYFASCKDFLDPETNADWDGEALGGFNESIDNPVGPAGEGEAAGSSLYCITVVTPGYVAEEELVNQQEAAGVGPFACDASSRMTGQAVGKGEWQSVQNTAVFVDIWNQVVEEGTYQSYDWTVKIDPDAVFFPNRLKGKIEALHAPRDAPLYLKNCGFKFGFMGSLEIFSRAAIDVYNQHQGDCLVNIGTDGGEDFYMKTCMDAIGVGHMEDLSLLRDRYDFVAFPGDFSPVALDDCSDGGSVAYHPHKTWDNWQECKSMSEAAEGSYDGGGD